MKKTIKATIQTAVRDRMKSKENGDAMVAIIVISFCAIAALIIIVSMFASVMGLKGLKTAEAASSPTVAKASPTTPSAPIDIFSVLAALAIIAIAIGIIIASVWFFRKMAIAKIAKNTNVDTWKTLIAKHREICADWASYELDAVKILDFPLMTDMREPATLALHKALKHALSLEPKDIRSVKFVDAATSPFSLAVNDLDVAFHAAEAEAHRVVWSRFSSDERRRLATAKNLLRIAMDSAASDSERQMAYKRVFKELEGLIRIPDQAVLALEKSHMLSLAA